MDTDLLYKYFSGQASDTEAKEIIDWIDEDIKHRKEFIKLRKSWIESNVALFKNPNKAKDAFNQFLDQTTASRERKHLQTGKIKKHMNVWQIAAAIAVLIAFSITGYLIGNKTEFLSSSEYYEISVPYGGKSTVTLSDGTKVWLNAGSKLKYKKDFGQESRNVLLEGEAYFNVAKQKHPFIVSTSHLNISVLGTVFNVKSYPEENKISTTLIEGKVRIDTKKNTDNPVYLTSNQKLTFLKNKFQSQVTNLSQEKENAKNIVQDKELTAIKAKEAFQVERNADIDKTVSWKSGKLIFDGETLESLSVILKRKYNMEFIFDSPELKDFTYSGTLKDYTLEQVLNAMKLTSPLNYSIQEKTVYFYFDENKKNKYEKITK